MLELGVWFSQARSRVPTFHGVGRILLAPHALLLFGDRLFGPLPRRTFVLALASEPATITLPYSMIRRFERPRLRVGYHHLWGWAGPTVIDLHFRARPMWLRAVAEFHEETQAYIEAALTTEFRGPR